MNELEMFVSVAQSLGRRKDIVQGSGGNISIKFGPLELIIKASGLTFSEITPDFGLVKVDIKKGLEFYNGLLKGERESSFSFSQIEGSYKPSIETGFHAVLEDRVVIHTHPLWTNILACSMQGEKLVRKMLGGRVNWVPYRTPGHNLAVEILRINNKKTSLPKIFILENHGLIVSAQSVEECEATHQEVIESVKQALINYGLVLNEWPKTKWLRAGDGWLAENPAISKYILEEQAAEGLLKNHPFPDAFVFLDGVKIVSDGDKLPLNSSTMILGRGMFYRTSQQRALEFDEIITASALIRELIFELYKSESAVKYLSANDLRSLKTTNEAYRQALKT